MQVKFIPRNLPQVQAFLKSLPVGALKTGLKAFAEYILGNEQRGLRHYEPYKYVKPFRSYSPNPDKAARQRAWIFAHLDLIGKNNRTGKTSAGWQMKETKGGYGITLINQTPGAKWIWSDKHQTRHQAAVGHRTIPQKIASNIKGALRHAAAEVRKWVKVNKPKK